MLLWLGYFLLVYLNHTCGSPISWRWSLLVGTVQVIGNSTLSLLKMVPTACGLITTIVVLIIMRILGLFPLIPILIYESVLVASIIYTAHERQGQTGHRADQPPRWGQTRDAPPAPLPSSHAANAETQLYF